MGVSRWKTRHSRSKKKEKGDVGVEKLKEKTEGERVERSRMEIFLGAVYHVLSDFESLDFMNFPL